MYPLHWCDPGTELVSAVEVRDPRAFPITRLDLFGDGTCAATGALAGTPLRLLLPGHGGVRVWGADARAVLDAVNAAADCRRWLGWRYADLTVPGAPLFLVDPRSADPVPGDARRCWVPLVSALAASVGRCWDGVAYVRVPGDGPTDALGRWADAHLIPAIAAGYAVVPFCVVDL